MNGCGDDGVCVWGGGGWDTLQGREILGPLSAREPTRYTHTPSLQVTQRFQCPPLGIKTHAPAKLLVSRDDCMVTLRLPKHVKHPGCSRTNTPPPVSPDREGTGGAGVVEVWGQARTHIHSRQAAILS